MPTSAQTRCAARLSLLLAALPTPADGRFATDDADSIDAEELYSSETFNDKISYAAPYAWQPLWQDHDSGYRVSAGSLNVRRFDFAEDIKAGTDPLAPVAIAFAQSRRGDVQTQATARTLRLAWRQAAGGYLALLGDGDTLKEYGDIGIAVGHRAGRATYGEVYAWSVDHYYASKKVEPGDRRSGPVYSFGLQGAAAASPGTTVAGAYEWDRPFTWERPSAGYRYSYEQRRASYAVEQVLAPDLKLAVAGEHVRKQEARSDLAATDTSVDESLRRRADTVAASLHYSASAGLLSGGVTAWWRDSDYSGSAPPLDGLRAPRPHPPWSRRREAALHTSWYAPVAAGSPHYLQTGLHANALRLDEGPLHHRRAEVKALLAWAYHIGPLARALVGTTWDLDQLAADFPYDEHGFRPWGGGFLQAVIAL